MKFAVIGDIHSNKYALKYVLKDIKKRNIDFIVSTGDLVGYLTHPNEVIHMLRESNVLSIMGNHDERVANTNSITKEVLNSLPETEVYKKGSLAYTSFELSEVNRNYLLNLPTNIQLRCNALDILVVHGSPHKIDEYLYEDSKALISVSRNIKNDVIISGHTHIPYHTIINGKHFINPGSVGKPKDQRPEATYMVLNITDEIQSEIVQVEYPVNKLIKAIKENPYVSDALIDHLKKGY